MELTKEMRTAFAEDIRAKASRVYKLLTEVATAIEGGCSTVAEMKDYGKYALPMPDRRREGQEENLKVACFHIEDIAKGVHALDELGRLARRK